MAEQPNILSYPSTVFVGRNVPKKAFYDNMPISNRIRQHFVDDIEQIVWLYKLTSGTLGVQNGKDVHEVAVFYVVTKSADCPNDVFSFIDKSLPRHTVFVLQHENRCRLLINFKQWTDESKGLFKITESYLSPWIGKDDIRLPIEGMSLDSVYNGFVSYISGIRAADNADLLRVVELRKEIASKKKTIDAIENKIRAERQFSNQMELNANLKIVRNDLQKLEQELIQLL